MSQYEQPIEVQIPIPGGHIAGCWYGDQNKRPILALHGWQDNAGSFARLAPLIAPYRPVLAIDFPGHGRSSHYPAGIRYDTLDYVRIVERTKRHYKWKHVSFMAHSMGASIAFVYAALRPQHVDMMIAIDKVKTRYFDLDIQITIMHHLIEKFLLEDERVLQSQQSPPNEHPEPPIYSFSEMERLLHEGSDSSVALENCKFILQRNVKPSSKHPDKYFFSRDPRVKVFCELYTEPGLTKEMARRIRNISYLVLKGENSPHLSDPATPILAILRENNPNFEFYSFPEGTHHLHLNNAEKVAEKVVPFVRKHLPVEEEPTRLGEHPCKL